MARFTGSKTEAPRPVRYYTVVEFVGEAEAGYVRTIARGKTIIEAADIVRDLARQGRHGMCSVQRVAP